MKPLLSELFLPCSGMHSPIRANRYPLTTITGAQRASGQTHSRARSHQDVADLCADRSTAYPVSCIRVRSAHGNSLDRIPFGPLPGPDCRISDWQRLSQEVSERVGQQTEGWVLFTSRGPDHLCYDECIGAKKHLVTSPPTGPPPGSKP